MPTYGQLVVQSGQYAGRLFPLDRPLITLGRSPENDLLLRGVAVSARHADLRAEDAANPALLTGLDSAAGTFLDSVRLLPHQPRLLTHGSRLRIGEHSLVYQDLRCAARAPSDAAGETPDQPSLTETIVPDDAGDQTAALPAIGLKPPLEPNEADAPPDDSKMRGYLQYLPVIFQENSFLSRFLQIFEHIWEPLEQRQDQMALYFDPRTCPARFLLWMAEWFGLRLHDGWSEARLRALLAEGIEMHRWFGTRYGLERMIETCAGVKAEITEPPRQPFVFHLKLTPMPKDDDLEFVRTLIRDFKPAHTDCVLLEDK
ncbi:MAG: phage tail protein [Blastocatellia bacterium]